MKDEAVVRLLQRAVSRKKAQSPGFSIRQMARKVGVSSPFLTQIINGRRTLPGRLITNICAVLDLDDERRDFLVTRFLAGEGLHGVSSMRAPAPEAWGNDWQGIPHRHFNILDEWYHLSVLNATLLHEYDGTADFISDRLELSTSVVEASLRKLEAFGFLEHREGKRVKKNAFNEFQSGARKEQIRQFHRSCLEKASHVLRTRTEDADVDRRLIRSLVVTGDIREAEWAKRRIAEVMREIAERMAVAPAEDVFQFSIQFFPTSR